MKTKLMAVWLASVAMALGQGSVVVPNGFGNVEGNSSTSDPFSSSSFRFQQVFSASQFGSSPFLINSISFRIDGASSGNVLYSFGGGAVQLSTTTRTPDSLSPVFADNIGSDVATVRSGAFSFGGLFQSGANPQPFGQTISTDPFFYNPAAGNLLVDIIAGGGLTLFPGSLDAQNTFGDSISRVYANTAGASSGSADTLGLVTRFNVTGVPEPSTWLLLLLGSGAAFIFKRR